MLAIMTRPTDFADKPTTLLLVLYYYLHSQPAELLLILQSLLRSLLRADLPTEPTLRWHCTATYHRQTDSAAMPAIMILIAPVRL